MHPDSPGIVRAKSSAGPAVIVTRLRLADMRSIQALDWTPAAGINLITGDNGAGKSTLLEALHLMAHGRSFRGRVRDGLVRSGADALEVVLDWQAQPSGPGHRAGLRHSGSQWQARLDGESLRQLGDLCAALAVTTFEPESHALVSGPADVRRRYLDWGMFHVEHEFLRLWRRYQRALKQRNALLKQGGSTSQLDAWESELAGVGEELSARRRDYVLALQAHVRASLASLLPQADGGELLLAPGWREDALALGDALLLSRERDLASGHTSVGPHRADLRLVLPGLPDRSGLSRGQAKTVALALLLGQAAHVREVSGRMPAVALDDLASELDRSHQRRVLQWLGDCGAQVFVTGTEPPAMLQELAMPVAWFHVEHGQLHPR